MKKPGTILMTADTLGGVWTYALDLARVLGPEGIRIVLATMGRKLSTIQRGEIAALKHVELCESEWPLEWMRDPWDGLRRAGDWLLEIEERVQPDLVHLNGYVHAALPWRCPTVVVAHSCVLSWWQAVKGEPAPDSWDRYRQAVTRGLKAAGAVIAPTRAMLSTLETNYGTFIRGRVIANGRELCQLPASRKQAYVLAVGRIWDEAKNIMALDHVATSLPWPILVAGDNTHPEGGRQPVEKVRLLGQLSGRALQRFYSTAPVFALPARYEPFGLSVLEAALCGCALVLGDIPSLRELWSGAALFVAPDDASQLQCALKALIEDESRRKACAARARARASHYTTKRMAGDYLRLYSEMLVAHSRAAARVQAVEEATLSDFVRLSPT